MKDKTVIVTGGGTGIGRAVSILLAQKGASIAIVYSKSKVDAESTVKEIVELGSEAIAVKADVSDEQQVKKMIETVCERFGNINYLVNNASITKQLPFKELELIDDAVWDELFSTNVKGMFYCAKNAAPIIKKDGNGAIVNIGSIAGVNGLGSSLPYAVTKSAVHGLSKSLAHALLPEVRVNCVVPGAVETRWWKGNEDKMNQLARKLPLGHVSTPEDIAEIVLLALTNRSMTGQLLIADNGQTL